MDIKRIGSYLEIDTDGYIVNPASAEKLQEKWIPVVTEIRQEYLKHFGDSLVSVYIRGSVAKSAAIENFSDVDSFSVVSLKSESIDITWADEFSDYITEKYPYVEGVEIGVVPFGELPRYRAIQIMIKTQSVCIYGKNLADHISALKPGKDTAQHVWSIGLEVDKTKEWLRDNHTDEETKRKCAWIMNRLLRSGFELVMERSQKYTRDLFYCYEGFSVYYPNKKEEMYHALEFAINPTADKTKIDRVLSTVGKWIVSEVKEVFNLS
jgi:hypothetical protein